MWARVSSFMVQDDEPSDAVQATPQVPGTSENDGVDSSEASGQLPAQEEPEWRPRFNLSLSLAELLYSWGFLRRKPSQTESQSESMQLGVLVSPSENENIELSSFCINQVATPICISSLHPPSDGLLSSSPIHLSTPNLFCDSDTLKALSPTSSVYGTASLKSFVWEEIEDLQSGLGHNFVTLAVHYPTWCDRCGDLLWGLTKEYLRCLRTLYRLYAEV